MMNIPNLGKHDSCIEWVLNHLSVVEPITEMIGQHPYTEQTPRFQIFLELDSWTNSNLITVYLCHVHSDYMNKNKVRFIPSNMGLLPDM